LSGHQVVAVSRSHKSGSGHRRHRKRYASLCCTRPQDPTTSHQNPAALQTPAQYAVIHKGSQFPPTPPHPSTSKTLPSFTCLPILRASNPSGQQEISSGLAEFGGFGGGAIKTFAGVLRGVHHCVSSASFRSNSAIAPPHRHQHTPRSQ
jgi:hypothetical protein